MYVAADPDEMECLMTKIQVFEPALCCNTGVCGEDVDQALVAFSADLDWVRSKGGDVSRHNLAGEPLAFAENPSVKGFLEVAGSAGLPLVLVDGTTILTGSYPNRDQLARWAGISTPPAAPAAGVGLQLTDISETGGCCSTDSGTQATTSGGCC